MGEITDSANLVFRDFVTPGVPSSGANAPRKGEIRELYQRIDSKIEELADLQADSVTVPTWAALAAIAGGRVGRRGLVPTSDAGTHTDPVVGGTVPNSGTYSWSASPAGWRRVDAYQDVAAVAAKVDGVGTVSGTSLNAVSDIQTLGDAIPAAGVGGAAAVLAHAEPARNAGYIGRFYGTATAAGTVYLKVFGKVGDVFTQVGSDYPVAVPLGAFSLGVKDFGVIPLAPGQYAGFWAPTNVIGRSNSTLAGGWYLGFAASNPTGFTDATVDRTLHVGATLTIEAPAVTARRVDALESSLAALLAGMKDMLAQSGGYSPALALAQVKGYWLDFTDADVLFQDAAGTTPARAHNDPIGLVRDKSGRGYHFTSSGANRPTLAAPGSAGKRCAVFGGTKGMLGQRLDFTRSASRVTVFVVEKRDGFVTGFDVPTLYHSTGVNSASARLVIGTPVRGDTRQVVGSARNVDNGTVAAANAPMIKDPNRACIRQFDFDFAAGKIYSWMNGANTPEHVGTLSAPGAATDLDELLAYLGGNPGVTTQGFNGEIYELVALSGSSDAINAKVLVGLGSKYGIWTIPAAKYDPAGLLSGAWTFFTDPRVLAISSTRFAIGAISPAGAPYVADFNSAVPSITQKQLHAGIEQDDHNNPAFLRRADGRLLAFFCAHNAPNRYYMALSTNADDATAWGAAVDIGPQLRVSDVTTSFFAYANPILIGTRIYLFLRAFDSGGVGIMTLHLAWSDDDGVTWTRAKQLLGDGRPYWKVRKTSATRIDILCNSGHPDEVPNCATFHFYFDGGNFYKSDGTLIGAIADMPFDQLTELTTVYDPASDSGKESWVWDIVKDPAGADRVAGFMTFSLPNNDPPVDNHLYHYAKIARWNGSAWTVKHVCDAGGTLYDTPGSTPVPTFSPSYSGGICIDPVDPNVVFVSRQVDGAGAIDIVNGVHQIFKCVTADGGDTWALTQLTFGSEKCFRPYIPEGGRRVFFCRGRYDSYYEYYTVIDSLLIA